MPQKKAVKSATKPEGVHVVKGPLKIKPGKPATVLAHQTVYQGPLFRVDKEEINEPNCANVTRDIVRHGGSVVILAIDNSTKRDPMVVLERQYRHAARQCLYEVPAGKIDPNEDRLAAAKRELAEETGFRAKKWTKLARYYASPGFLAESMQVFLAEGLTPGATSPDEDERIELLMVPFSELLRLIDKGDIHDGKTIIAATMYARRRSKAVRRS
ncbi:MAG TPA: NUDIX hydrolase [Acidobacteriaceae bacterium]|nr:NUDIX hydrolase [Acidobacteriaceae bacterium]